MISLSGEVFRSCTTTLGEAAAIANDVRVDLDRAGTPDQKTLRFVASFADQRSELFLRLNTFCEHRQPQSMRKANDGTNDCQRSVRSAQACDERSVDLDPVERERLQIGQRGVSRSEIVQGNTDAQYLESFQHRRRARDVLDQYTLGNLELKLR